MKFSAIVGAVAAVLAQVNGFVDVDAGAMIVGGEPAPEGRYPYYAGLTSTQNGNPYCGGTLISPTLVLTAAHCPQSSYVMIGCLNFGGSCERLPVSKSLVHPNYSSRPTPTNDFRLMYLSKASSYDPMPNLASSVWDDIPTGTDVTVIGFGTTSSGGSQSSRLLQVVVDVTDPDDCADDYKNYNIDESMICASRSGKDSCQGDSGGPLFVACDNGADVLVGVVSWGIGCADARYPGVYARVSDGIDWITTNVKAHGDTLATPTSNMNSLCSSSTSIDISAVSDAEVAPTPAPTCSGIYC